MQNAEDAPYWIDQRRRHFERDDGRDRPACRGRESKVGCRGLPGWRRRASHGRRSDVGQGEGEAIKVGRKRGGRSTHLEAGHAADPHDFSSPA